MLPTFLNQFDLIAGSVTIHDYDIGYIHSLN
jgi:hypothetical protein